MHNIILFGVCLFIGIQTLHAKEPEIQSLIDECVTKGMEKQNAEVLVNAILLERQIPTTIATTLSNRQERVRIRMEAVRAIDILSSNKLARPVALGLWNPNMNMKKAAIDQLFELKDPKTTDIVIQALEDNIRMLDGSERATSHEAFVIDLVKLLNVLTGSNYQLDIYNDTEARRKEIVKAAKEKLAKQHETATNNLAVPQPSTNVFVK